MDFKQLEAFAAVVEKNSFSEAAKVLFLTQPTISAHVRALEEELNTTLINRSTKSVSVTKDGYRLYDYAMNILSLRRKAEDEFRSDSDSTIFVGASTIPSAYMLPMIMREYSKKNRDAVFSVCSGAAESITDRLVDGSIDIGLVGAVTPAPQIELTEFVRDRMVICTPVNDHYLQMKKDGAPLAALLAEPVILRQQGGNTKKELNYLFDRLGIAETNLKVVAYMNDLEAVQRCIAGGMGISIMSYLSVREAAQKGEVLIFEPEELPKGRMIYVAVRKDKMLNKQAKDFAHYLTHMENGFE